MPLRLAKSQYYRGTGACLSTSRMRAPGRSFSAPEKSVAILAESVTNLSNRSHNGDSIMNRRLFLLFLAFLTVTTSLPAATTTFFSSGSAWKYVLGTNEASNPMDAWRGTGFSDAAWGTGASPLGYANPVNDPPESGIATVLPDPRTSTSYQTVYFRKTFTIANPADLVRLDVLLQVDDGYVAWLNGTEIGRDNVAEGIPFSGDAAPTSVAPHVTTIVLSNNLSSLLLTGANVLAVHVLNAAMPNDDLFFDAAVSGLIDDQGPTIINRFPDPGATVAQLIAVEVTFNEPVANVDAADLLINGTAAVEVLAATPSQYQFTFPQPPTGTVQITWASGHGIVDLANTPNAFIPVNWSYVLDTNFTPQVVINEFLASNTGDGPNAIRDDDGRSADWIELYNRGGQPVNLQGWSITDNANNRRKYVIQQSVVLQPNSYLIVWAGDPPTIAPATRLYTSFALSADAPGEYLGLFDARTNLMSQFPQSYPSPATYGQQQPDVSMGRDQSNPQLTGFFTTPTPGGPNNVFTGSSFAPEVVFSRSGGTFTGPFQLTLSTPGNTNAVIRYSLVSNATVVTNNTLPSASSNLYTGPITINNTVIVRARAFLTNANSLPGPPHSECYILLNNNLTTFSSDLPLVVLHTVGSGGSFPTGYPQSDRTTILAVFDTKYGRSSLTNKPDLIVRAGTNLRGSSTQGYNKSSWAVEAIDEFGDDTAVEVLGMPAESDWVLYAPNHFDKVLLHNPVAYEISNDLGRYASRTRMVEVFVDTGGGDLSANMNSSGANMGNYNGVYVLEEKVKRDGDRVDVEQLLPENTNSTAITGGYLLKIDRVDPDEDPSDFSAGNQGMIFAYPAPLDMATPQFRPHSNYIASHFNAFYAALTGPNWTNPATGYPAYIDIDSWIDHNMLGVLTLNADWLRLSGYFFKDRGKKIEMGPIWDHDRAEGTSPAPGMAVDDDWRAYGPRTWNSQAALGAGGTDYGTDFFNNNNVFGNPWYLRLFRDVDFWQRWIDRYQDFRQTALDTNRIVRLIDEMAEEVRNAQVREVTRWNTAGNSDTRPRNGTVINNVASLRGTPYTNVFDGTYLGPRGEVAFLKRWWMDRINFIDTNFIAKPIIGVNGGPIVPPIQVSIADVSGKAGTAIYYTTDGTDPRASGGGIAANALLYSGPITVTTNARLVARARNLSHRNMTGANNPPTNSVWSGMSAATYVAGTPPLRITEIMYHPADPPSGNTNDDNNFEYVEVKNIGSTPLNLNRFRFTEGIQFEFPSLLLAGGQSVVVVSDTNAFRSRYGSGPVVAGVYSGRLDNAGERIVLEGGLREPIHDFEYNDNWYPATDGHGFSLVIVNENAPLNTWGLKTSWRPSGALNGSPGQNDTPANIPVVVVNEALTHADFPAVDAVELHNLSGSPVNIGGWFLTDDFSDPFKFVMPSITIPGGGYHVFDANEFDPGGAGFAFSEHGEEVWIFSGNGVDLTGYSHGFAFGAAQNSVTFGRHVISTGEDHFVAQAGNTLDFPNAGPIVFPVVISEINYHPPPVGVGDNTYENLDDEYIELLNLSESPTPLFDPSYPTNKWRLRDAVDFEFPANTTLAPAERILIVNFDAGDSGLLAAFRNRLGVAPTVRVFGPFSGRLANEGEDVELVKPGTPELPGPPDFGLVPYILVDKVDYNDKAPWPIAADGFGPSLHRFFEFDYGNDPANWVAATRTPGQGYTAGAVPTITAQPASQTVVAFNSVTFTVQVSGPGPFSFQWRFNGEGIGGATSSSLMLQNIQPSDAGEYSVVVMNNSGSVLSSNAVLTVLVPATVLQHPQTIRLRGSTNDATFGFTFSNVIFSVVAITDNPPLTYQWRRSGDGTTFTNIPGATGSTLAINSATIADEGFYDAVVSDAIGSRPSEAAELSVLVPIYYVQQPQPENQIIAAGDTATFNFKVKGHPLPITYRWRAASGFVTNIFLNALESTFLIHNAPIHTGNVYTVLASNLASSVPGLMTNSPFLSSNAYLVVAIPPRDTTAVVGSDVTLFGAARSGAGFHMRWQFNGTDIPGTFLATNRNYITNRLVLTSVQPSQSGIYSLVVLSSNMNYVRAFDAVLTVIDGDDDGDGMPNAWEDANGLQRNVADGDGDADMDGVKNRDEYTSGTDPQSAQSYLRVEDIDTDPNGVAIEFNAVSNKTYSIVYQPTADGSNWVRLLDIAPQTTNRTERIIITNPPSPRFFRLITPRAAPGS